MAERPVTRGDFLKLVLPFGWVPEAIRNGGLSGLSGPAQVSLVKDVALFGWPLSAACGSGAADRVARTDSQWKSMLKKQGEIVERDLARVGLTGYHPLVPFDQLTEERRRSIPNLPKTGYLALEETVAGTNVRFLWQVDREPASALLVVAPYGLIRTSILEGSGLPPEVQITLDLAQYISYVLVPDGYDPRYKRGQFNITRYENPRDYLNTPNAIISADIKGDRESLSPILRTAI